MKRKICIITCTAAINYGARLQALALQDYLSSQGFSVEIIDYRPDYLEKNTHIWYWPGKSLKEWVKLFIRFNKRKKDIKREQLFKQFSQRYLIMTKNTYHNIEELTLNAPVADVYIAGSDQIWNTRFPNGFDKAFYLLFGSDNIKRISYAASFADKNLLPGNETLMRNNLKRFNVISVREKSGINILASLGYEGFSVMDPVFLLGQEEWNDLLNLSNINARYILVYDFMLSGEIERLAKRLATLRKCEIWTIGSYNTLYAHKNFYEAGPGKFVELIKNAECIISDSFHGTAFSIIYRKDFFVVERNDGLNERMYDLLLRLELKSQLINLQSDDNILLKGINYSLIQNNLDKEIEISKNFLSKALSNG